MGASDTQSSRILDRSDLPKVTWSAVSYSRHALRRSLTNLKSDYGFIRSISVVTGVCLSVFLLLLVVIFLPARPILLLRSAIAVTAASVLSSVLLVGCGGLLRSARGASLGWANRLSAVRFLLAAPIAVLVLGGEPILALVMYVICLFTDVLDGIVARRRRERSGFGTVIDPIADIVSTAALFWAMWTVGLVPSWLLAALLARYVSLFAVGAAVYAAVGPVRLKATPIGKIVGVLQGVAGIIILVLAGSDVQLVDRIGVTMFPFLGIIFGSVIVSQVIIAVGFVRDGAKCRILKAT
jgi:cardiolipin synthase